MATAYTPILQLALPVTGELQGTWGTVVNDNITSMIEQAIAGLATVSTWTAASHTLTTANGTTDEARCAVLECSGAPGAAATVICPALSKVYVIKNSVTGGYAVTLKTSAGTGISVPNGSTALLYCDGTNVVSGATYMATVSTTQVDILAQGDLRLQDTTGGEYVALQAPATIASSYTLTLPVDDGTAGQALITDGSGVLSWSTAASGDVYGPASATDNAVARYDGTTGKIIQNSAVTIADDGATVIAANSASDGLRITQLGAGNALLVEDSANPDATPFVVAADGKVAIGSTTATENLNLVSDGRNFLQFNRASTDTNASVVSFRKARGTNAAPTIIASGDLIGDVQWSGYDGAAYIQSASIYAAIDGTPGTNDMPGRLQFFTTADGASTPTERMRISSSGGVGIGATPSADISFIVAKNVTGGATSYGIAESGTVQSDVTTAANMFLSNPKTVASAFTLGNLFHYNTIQGTKGVGSTITNQFGFNADSTLTGATNNYGFYGNIASGTGRYNFYAAGTAANYFAGVTTVASNLIVSNANPTLLVGDSSLSTGTANIQIGNGRTGDGLAFIDLVGDVTYSDYGFRLIRSGTANGATQLQHRGTGAFSFTAAEAATITFVTASTERLRIDSTGTISLGAAPGSESLRVTPVASAVNYLNVQGGITGNYPYFIAQGSDTNVSAGMYSKGTGALFFGTGTTTNQFVIAHTASAVNYLTVTGSSTGFNPALYASGSDTNISMTYAAKGTGSHQFFTNNTFQFVVAHTASAVNYLQVTGGDGTTTSPMFSAQGSSTDVTMQLVSKGSGQIQFLTNVIDRQFNISHTASAVNYLQVTGSSTSNAPNIAVAGSDTNINLVYITKGTGAHYFQTSSTNQFVVAHTASAVNYLQVTGSSGTAPSLSAQGSGTNLVITYATKGTGYHNFTTNGTSVSQFLVSDTASAVNYLQVTGAATAGSPTILTGGSDTNIDLALTPKGTGVLKFGTYTAGVVAQAGYITIKDAGGTTRRLLVG